MSLNGCVLCCCNSFCQTKIDHFDRDSVCSVRVVCNNHDVARFEVAMEKSMLFGSGKRARYLFPYVEHHRQGQGSVAANTRFECFAFHQLHCVETLARRSFAEVKNRRDIRMAKLRGGSRFTPKALAHFWIPRE